MCLENSTPPQKKCLKVNNKVEKILKIQDLIVLFLAPSLTYEAVLGQFEKFQGSRVGDGVCQGLVVESAGSEVLPCGTLTVRTSPGCLHLRVCKNSRLSGGSDERRVCITQPSTQQAAVLTKALVTVVIITIIFISQFVSLSSPERLRVTWNLLFPCSKLVKNVDHISKESLVMCLCSIISINGVTELFLCH